MRNLYGEDLDPVKTSEVQAIALRFFGGFATLHRDFKEKLLAIAEKSR